MAGTSGYVSSFHAFTFALIYFRSGTYSPEIPPSGLPCCPPNFCKVKEHLGAKWEKYDIINAWKISEVLHAEVADPPGVLGDAFDDSSLNLFTTALAVDVCYRARIASTSEILIKTPRCSTVDLIS